jgi:hypothetical protein
VLLFILDAILQPIIYQINLDLVGEANKTASEWAFWGKREFLPVVFFSDPFPECNISSASHQFDLEN